MDATPNIPDGIQTALSVWMLKEIFSIKHTVQTLTSETENMKRKLSGGTIALLFGLPIIALFSGCLSPGSAATVRALSKDPAIISMQVGTPWGVQKIIRVGGQTNSVQVNPDGSVIVNAPR